MGHEEIRKWIKDLPREELEENLFYILYNSMSEKEAKEFMGIEE